MKRLVIVVLLVFSLSAVGQNREYDKFIEKYDIERYIKTLPKDCPSDFWKSLWMNSERLAKLSEAIKEGKGSAKEALSELMRMESESEPYYNSLEYSGYVIEDSNSIYTILGIKRDNPQFRFIVISDPTLNAFSLPDGRVFINNGLLDVGLESESLLGILAHEITHYILQHALEENYRVIKKLKKNNIIAAVAASVNIVANGYAQAQGGMDEKTKQESWDRVNETTESLIQWAKEDTYGRYKYKYSRGQELEADLVAFRFLEYIGIDGRYYIDALRMIDPKGANDTSKKGEKANREDDHPTTAYRIDFLEYVSQKGMQSN